ncbi:hypothetical protein A3A21_04050 [Candidatus Jorgensenbacteria bacterium RIFCSPLOWO2_01_FULL_45_25b]|uniref:Uncharacterized protein n=1 Tax=Candidatus Jorgensenbacteria bacterium RIFCSPLOWO2_01_FULL_45_25b TaxID=1798471 RepID=A0A1F6BWJ1_9BACT|nr:MAG: hypothetical protein A3A21_04050 [Candidatus Jorgensenbacteria bacterium RIFCSPLOWO2_01_FULL_45_25b]
MGQSAPQIRATFVVENITTGCRSKNKRDERNLVPRLILERIKKVAEKRRREYNRRQTYTHTTPKGETSWEIGVIQRK